MHRYTACTGWLLYFQNPIPEKQDMPVMSQQRGNRPLNENQCNQVLCQTASAWDAVNCNVLPLSSWTKYVYRAHFLCPYIKSKSTILYIDD